MAAVRAAIERRAILYALRIILDFLPGSCLVPDNGLCLRKRANECSFLSCFVLFSGTAIILLLAFVLVETPYALPAYGVGIIRACFAKRASGTRGDSFPCIF